MSDGITAYRPVVASLKEQPQLKPGQMVRVDQSAVEQAGIGEADQNENFDNEYNYEQYGFILEIYRDDFRWYDEEADKGVDVEVGDEDVYAVGMAPLEAGSHLFTGDTLTKVNSNDILSGLDLDADPADATSDSGSEENAAAFDGDLETDELASPSEVPGITRNQMGLQPWPESWREANKPARLIAMDAWASMGATFRGCRRSMVGSMSNPNRFCAAFKDGVYGHHYWRGN